MTADLEARMEDFQRCIETRDRSLAEQVLDDDYALELVHPTVGKMPCQRWLEVLSDYIVHAYAVEETVVDRDGDCAVVLQRVTMQATVLGEDRSGQFVITDIWRLRDDGWRLWRRHSTPLTAGDMPGVDA
jgi:ketosteroid isomerase-like protein